MSPGAAPERLNRFLARRGVASRRGADTLIATGRVRVDGEPARVGASVDPRRHEVTVDGRPVAAGAGSVSFLLNKPAGVVTTVRDPQRRPTVMSLVPQVPGLVPVGRLDADSRGLLLLTTDGELAHRVSHPRYELHRTYRVRVRPEPTPAITRRLEHGVVLDDGPAVAISARMAGAARTLEIVMGEGRRREVRRMCAAVGLEVIDLQRVAYGPLRLRGTAEGAARPLKPEEETALRRAVGLPSRVA